MYVKEEEFVVRKPMSFEEMSRIFNAIQRQNARQAILSKDKAKKSLTYKELLNKFAQAGGVVRFGRATFTFDQDYAMGVIETPNQKVMGATIDDFIKLVKEIKRAQ